jgi:hypothetical protein
VVLLLARVGGTRALDELRAAVRTLDESLAAFRRLLLEEGDILLYAARSTPTLARRRAYAGRAQALAAALGVEAGLPPEAEGDPAKNLLLPVPGSTWQTVSHDRRAEAEAAREELDRLDRELDPQRLPDWSHFKMDDFTYLYGVKLARRRLARARLAAAEADLERIAREQGEAVRCVVDAAGGRDAVARCVTSAWRSARARDAGPAIDRAEADLAALEREGEIVKPEPATPLYAHHESERGRLAGLIARLKAGGGEADALALVDRMCEGDEPSRSEVEGLCRSWCRAFPDDFADQIQSCQFERLQRDRIARLAEGE